ncbi:GntR family transcriptional regulator [Comamonas serinivorans]|uniref:GntR family transcriptional regulator n=1 Tax=Comamonas serinivorans TaxID=1082851 RepID=A0A1Y0ETT7_9BURK|nr:GntR family transcriptional regulator [Comamonas serinivorans]ARU06662.1 GntR family transcriptional regulator [Comamonas serinivorans]
MTAKPTDNSPSRARRPAAALPVHTWGSLHVDTASSEPLYLQLLRQVKQLLASGAIAPGVGLPSERLLAEHLGVSRMVVKRCYDELRQDETLSSNGRGGTLLNVTSRVMPAMGRLKGFTEEMRELGMQASSRVLKREVLHDRTIASVFNRPSQAQFLHVVRIRYGDQVPMTRENAWYDLQLAPGLVDWNGEGSIYTHLQQACGIEPDWAEQTVEAVLSSAEENEAFGWTDSQPCLLLKRHSHSTSQMLFEYVEGVFRGDAYVYKTRLKA